MPTASESFVQVPPNSTGARVRNVQVDVVQPDGTLATVQMQVIAIRDEQGQPLVTDMSQLLKSIYSEIKAVRMILGRSTGQHFLALDTMREDVGDLG